VISDQSSVISVREYLEQEEEEEEEEEEVAANPSWLITDHFFSRPPLITDH
jgi:hypothetical protein